MFTALDCRIKPSLLFLTNMRMKSLKRFNAIDSFRRFLLIIVSFIILDEIIDFILVKDLHQLSPWITTVVDISLRLFIIVPMLYFLVFRPLTTLLAERKGFGTILTESDQRMRTLIEQAPIGIALFRDGITLDANPAYLKMFGYDDIGELQGTPLFNQISHHCRDEIIDRVKRRAAGENLENTYEATGLRKNNSRFPFLVSVNRIMFPDGPVTISFFVDITEHKRTEIELRDERERMRSILDLVGNPIFLKDNDHHITFANNAFYELFNMDEKNVIGKTLVEAVPENERHHFLKVDRSVLDTGIPDQREEELTVKNFTRNIITRKSRFIDKSGNRFLVGSINDITERKHAEELVKASELRFRTVSNNLIDIIYEWDIKERIDWYGDIDTLMGFENGTFPRLLNRWVELLHPDDTDKITTAIENQLKNNIPYNVEYRIRNNKNEWRWWSARGSVLKDGDGTPYKWIGSITDITEQKLAEDALRSSEKKYRTLHESMIDGFVSVGMDGKFLECNEVYRAMLGYSETELSQLSYFDITPERWHVYELEIVQNQIMKRGYSDIYEKEYRRKDGTIFPVELHTVLIRDEQDNPMSMWAIARDISERKHGEEEILRLNNELELRVVKRTAQLEAINKELEAFSYSVSHDLRAPLRHVSGYVDLLTRHFSNNLSEKGNHYVESIAESANQMGTLIDDLLQFSRTGRSEMIEANVDMNEIVHVVLRSLKNGNSNRRIEWSVSSLPQVMCDKAMMKLVWINLLQNAVKFTKNKETARIEIGFRDEVTENVFFVRDNGVGFDMQYADKLFGVFQRLHSKAEFEGTGIGLANVQRIVLRHGGRTWAESKLNNGATFYFTILKKKEYIL